MQLTQQVSYIGLNGRENKAREGDDDDDDSGRKRIRLQHQETCACKEIFACLQQTVSCSRERKKEKSDKTFSSAVSEDRLFPPLSSFIFLLLLLFLSLFFYAFAASFLKTSVYGVYTFVVL